MEDWLANLIAFSWTFLSSNLASSAVVALLSAFAGAFAATRFAEYKEKRSERLVKLNTANLIVTLSGALFETSYRYKEKIIEPMYSQYFRDRKQYQDYWIAMITGGEPRQLSYTNDFKTLKMFRHDASTIQDLLTKSLVSPPNLVLAAIALSERVEGLEELIALRSSEIVRLERVEREADVQQFAQIYFGIEVPGVGRDLRFHDSIVQLRQAIDGVMFFSIYLADGLSQIAELTANEIGKTAPKHRSIGITSDADPSLLSNPADFPAFPVEEVAFKKQG